MTTRRLRLLALAAVGCLALAGCGGSSTADSMEGMPGMSASDRPSQVIAVTVDGGAVTPAPDVHEIPLGSQVELTVTADVADEIHVHGYDEHLDLEAGVPGTLAFTADIPGDFEAELEDAGLQLLELRVE